MRIPALFAMPEPVFFPAQTPVFQRPRSSPHAAIIAALATSTTFVPAPTPDHANEAMSLCCLVLAGFNAAGNRSLRYSCHPVKPKCATPV